MLIPITRQKFEQIIPLIATSPQYAYYWGKFPEFLKRLLISLVAVVVVLLVGLLLGSGFNPLRLLLGIGAGLYWFWGPVYWASMRNIKIRRYQYSGFWRGRVLDVFVTEELTGTEENVNNRGELVIVENRERRLNVEVGDETGFTTLLQVPIRRTHKGIVPGQMAEMLVMSSQPDLGRIAQTSDIYIPRLNIWVSDYPYLQRDIFAQVSRQLRDADEEETYPAAPRIVKTKRRRR
ncbi:MULTISPECIES: phosphate ABC transporter permease [unclassified Coleofasciculus]|uniref:phosphate ABC transporter permease n=1 Tax=unclassified Coleofasciculus TaxID=2692782 RepID=UPI001880DBE9|nr:MULTISPECIES: phosphate ABC transporter permease [unclassified Coleofasciculus]MBE9128355.1 phosphate ABC transporter permease [Coleofasciculus sp. LEGE 07081]MBE9151411.1 phosphate ABC transporter permease [Coleofasciculus sp. LEGE 07092]